MAFDRSRLFHYVLIGALLLLLYLAFLILRPYASFLIFGLLLAYLLYPLYRRLRDWTKRPSLAAALMLIAVLIVLILPSGLFISKLVTESVSAYNSFRAVNVSAGPLAHLGIDLNLIMDQAAAKVKDYFVNAAPSIIGSLADFGLGLFLMFFLLFYAFRDGESWSRLVEESVPLDPEHKHRLFARVGSLTDAVIYGHFLTALIQGSLGGIMFLIFGIPNPLFWGVIMIILAFIPFLGTPLVFIPAGIIALYQNHYVAGLGVLIVGFVIVMNVDNVLRPWLISTRDRLSTLLVVLGVFGGLKIFGFIGLLVGPLILALLQTVIEFFQERPAKVMKKVK